jgi:soluble lytic murein transglycosylase
MGALATIHLWTTALATPAFAADIYQYIEPDGTVAFTNVPTDSRYRKVATDASRASTRASRTRQAAAADSLPSDGRRPETLPAVRAARPEHSDASDGAFPALSWREYQRERLVEEAIAHHASLQQLSPALVRAVIKAESDFDPWAISRAGAMGLMQLMPQTAVEVGVFNPYDPEDNIGGGTKYLRYLLDRFQGNLALALAAYNAGLHRVERHRGVPPIQETREYVTKVLRFYRAFLSERAPSSTGSRAARFIPTAGASPLVAFSASPIR